MFDSRRVSAAALLLLPTGLMAYLAFHAGGFYTTSSAFVGVVLALILLLRVVGAIDPLEGAGWPLLLGAVPLALLTLLALLSEHWSHAPGVALVEFVRPLDYVVVMVLFGTFAHSLVRLAWILRVLALGLVVLCGCALVTRLLPHVWPTSANIANNRLSFPVTYWNVLGLLAAFGIVLCLHFASDERESPAVRIAGAIATPILASTLYFTFSRGSIAVCIVALIAYVLLGHPRGLVSAVVATVPAVAVALKVSYDANLLATLNPSTPAAVAQGRNVALVLVGCCIAAGLLRTILLELDRRTVRLATPLRQRRVVRLKWPLVIATIALLAVIFSGTISREYHTFLKPAPPGRASDLRSRLTDPGNNGRLETWRVAWHQFQAKPILGTGVGTYKNTFLIHRTSGLFVIDAHSLYLETLDELGVVGLVLLLLSVLSVLVVAAVRIRGPSRALYAALFCVLLAWALETGIDWDWEMPVVTILFFALGGFVLARPLRHARDGAQVDAAAATPSSSLSPQVRTLIGVGCLLAAVAPAYVWVSQRRLDLAMNAFVAGDCRTAEHAALSSLSVLGNRGEPYEIVAYCDLRRGQPNLAIRAISKAETLDPQDWNYAYGLALMRAAAGLNPLPAARRALALNPKEPLAREAWDAFSTDIPSEWQSDGKTIADAFRSL